MTTEKEKFMTKLLRLLARPLIGRRAKLLVIYIAENYNKLNKIK